MGKTHIAQPERFYFWYVDMVLMVARQPSKLYVRVRTPLSTPRRFRLYAILFTVGGAHHSSFEEERKAHSSDTSQTAKTVNCPLYGYVAQSGERQLVTLKVGGPKPSIVANIGFLKSCYKGISPYTKTDGQRMFLRYRWKREWDNHYLHGPTFIWVCSSVG